MPDDRDASTDPGSDLSSSVIKERVLVIVRHGQSEFNLQNRFTGTRDVELTAKGIEEAHEAGRKLKAAGLTFDLAFSSIMKRARQTLACLLDELGEAGVAAQFDVALDERDYGELTGLNKDDVRRKWGDAQYWQWHRSFTGRPPGGESLRDTGARVWPYYLTRVLPEVLRGRRVLISAHGNSLRAMMMTIENLSEKEIETVSLPTATPVVYRLNADSTLASKQVL